MVGSHDTRKNHLAVLHAAEVLWQDGLRVPADLHRQRRIQPGVPAPGRGCCSTAAGPSSCAPGCPTSSCEQAVADARFTVFPSLHEGYGLPVAESLALGTPVITTYYGSTAEIAEGGGAMTVDPRDDAALTAAMRQLLTDDAEIDRLRAEIARRARKELAGLCRRAMGRTCSTGSRGRCPAGLTHARH